MAGDRAVGGIRQPPLLQGRGNALRCRVGTAFREKAVQHDAVDFAAADGSRAGARHQPGAAAGDGDLVRLRWRAFAGQSLLLQLTAAGDEEIPGGRIQPLVLASEAGLDRMRQGEVDVVAAEQDVLADGHPADAAFSPILAPLLPVDGKQAEVRRAAADIDDENVAQLASAVLRSERGAQRLPGGPFAAVLLQPGVERRLRLFEQANRARIAGGLRRHQRQPLGGGVE